MEIQHEEIKQKFNEKKRNDLFASFAIDALGMATYLIPGLGETADLIIAPIVATLIYSVHKTTIGAIGGFIEEALPFTDIIPSATIIWVYRYILKGTHTFNDFKSQFSRTYQTVKDNLPKLAR